MIDRATVIRRSIERFARQQLFDVRGYSPDKVEFLDAYPTVERMTRPLDKNYVAIGWQTDDGGREAELGSPMRRRLHTLDFYVFGTSRVWGENLASVLRYAMESDENIPLVNPADNVVFDSVAVNFASAQQVMPRQPRPWEENAWITRIRVEDYYNSSHGG